MLSRPTKSFCVRSSTTRYGVPASFVRAEILISVRTVLQKKRTMMCLGRPSSFRPTLWAFSTCLPSKPNRSRMIDPICSTQSSFSVSAMPTKRTLKLREYRLMESISFCSLAISLLDSSSSFEFRSFNATSVDLVRSNSSIRPDSCSTDFITSARTFVLQLALVITSPSLP